MKVLYDYQCFMLQKYGGISNCFAQLAAAMPADIDVKIGVEECSNMHLLDSGVIPGLQPAKVELQNFISTRKFPFKYELHKLASDFLPGTTALGKNRRCTIEMLKSGDFDVFHPTEYDNYFLRYIGKKPFVMTVHDMIPELFFEKKGGNVLRKHIQIEKAAHVIAVSENTKADIIDLLKVPEKKITVIYHGAPDMIEYDSKPMFDFPYILYVGQRDGYKNFVPMLKAVAPVLAEHPEIRMVCTSKDFKESENALIHSLGLTDRVIHITAGNAQLMNLYHNALCMIFPSRYEGFGIPILESWQTGCPILLNRRSCFPEIAADAAIWFNLDENPEESDLAQVLGNFLNQPERREELLKKQEQRLKLYSWKKSAEKLANVYRSIL